MHTSFMNAKLSTKNRLCSLVLAAVAFALTASILVLGASLPTASAAETRAMQAVPSYANPITNLIEDTGQNMALGQAMSEDLVKATPATMLIDLEGTIFFTFRMGLVEESANLAIELLGEDGQAVESLPFSIVEDFPDDNERDIRISVPTENPTLRISLVATPMGREVICFATFAPEGEAVEIPIAEIDETVEDDAAITIVEADPTDEILGVSDEARDQILLFLSAAAGMLLVIVAVAVYSYFSKQKKKKEAENNRAGKDAKNSSESSDSEAANK